MHAAFLLAEWMALAGNHGKLVSKQQLLSQFLLLLQVAQGADHEVDVTAAQRRHERIVMALGRGNVDVGMFLEQSQDRTRNHHRAQQGQRADGNAPAPQALQAEQFVLGVPQVGQGQFHVAHQFPANRGW